MLVRFICDIEKGTLVELIESDYRDAQAWTAKLTPDEQLVLAKRIDAACGTELCEERVRREQGDLRDKLRSQVREKIADTAAKSKLLAELEEA
jgi:hypothetical protein